jgi:hypothetical protein
MSTSEQVAARRPQRAARPKPEFICRAKVQNGWISIGAAWPLRSGESGFSVKLTSIPIGFDGRFVMLPPLPDGSEPEPSEE